MDMGLYRLPSRRRPPGWCLLLTFECGEDVFAALCSVRWKYPRVPVSTFATRAEPKHENLLFSDQHPSAQGQGQAGDNSGARTRFLLPDTRIWN